MELLVFLAARLSHASKRISYIENICKVGRDNNISSVRVLCNQRAVTAHCDDPVLQEKQSEQIMHLFQDPNILQQPGLGCCTLGTLLQFTVLLKANTHSQ